MPPHPQPSGDPRFVHTAAWLVGAGAAGIALTSFCYVMAGPMAALPAGGTTVEASRAATASAAHWMLAAGRIGPPGDLLAAVGAVMIAATKRGHGAGLAAAGWLGLALAGALFVIVDAMVGHVLPPMAALPNGEAAYAGMRALFDALFAVGTWAAGAGALASSWQPNWPEYRWKTVLWMMRAAGVACLAGSTAWLLRLPGSELMGLGIALSSVALVAAAVALHSAPGAIDTR